jgi:hypothetical protein
VTAAVNPLLNLAAAAAAAHAAQDSSSSTLTNLAVGAAQDLGIGKAVPTYPSVPDYASGVCAGKHVVRVQQEEMSHIHVIA